MSVDFLRNSFKGNDQERMRRKKSTPLHFSLLLLFVSYLTFLCVFIENESFFPKIHHSSFFPAHNYQSCSLESFVSFGILFLFSAPCSVRITSSVLLFSELLSSASFCHFWESVRRSGRKTSDFQMRCVP